MYDKIFKLIQNGELNKAQEQLENTPPENDPKRYNISGLIYYQKKKNSIKLKKNSKKD